MKSNEQVAKDFAAMINETTSATQSNAQHMSATKDENGVCRLYSYSTIIAYYEPANKVLILNVTSYSTTTSTKHQTHFYTIKKSVYGSHVKSIYTVDNVNRWNPRPLYEYIEPNRYEAQDGQSWDDKPLYRVFDTVSKSIVKTYKIKRYAIAEAQKLNEAQRPQ